jgi:hypothetical protein
LSAHQSSWPPFNRKTLIVAADCEGIYVSAILSTRTASSGNYPGEVVASPNWPNVVPGKLGVNNGISPKYLRQDDFITCQMKPPVLWIHGIDDQIVSDNSLFDMGFLGQLGAVPGWPGSDIFPPQPMKTQVRTVLEQYKANGGEYREVALPDCGHSPRIEKQAGVVALCMEFVDTH